MYGRIIYLLTFLNQYLWINKKRYLWSNIVWDSHPLLVHSSCCEYDNVWKHLNWIQNILHVIKPSIGTVYAGDKEPNTDCECTCFGLFWMLGHGYKRSKPTQAITLTVARGKSKFPLTCPVGKVADFLSLAIKLTLIPQPTVTTRHQKHGLCLLFNMAACSASESP